MSNIKELMRQEIERRKKVYLTKNGFPKGTFGAIKIETYEGLLAFIDSLPEEKPSDDLEEAAYNHIRKVVDAAGHPGWDWTTQDIAEAFIAGAEWQKEQMMKDAVEVDVADLNGEIYNNCIEKGMTDEDKVKIIIVKKDE